MTRFVDYLTGALTGLLVGVVLMAATTTTRPFDSSKQPWDPTPRPSQQPTPRPGTRGMTTDGVSFVPSPDAAGRTEAPSDVPAASPSPTTGTRPASTRKPRAATPSRHTASGTATWYCLPGLSACTAGRGSGGLYAAAGPALRVGDWRGRVVTVELADGSRAVRVRLVDSCTCGGGRVIDLYHAAFRRLADPSRGVIRVEVSW